MYQKKTVPSPHQEVSFDSPPMGNSLTADYPTPIERETEITPEINDLCSICDHKPDCSLRSVEQFTLQCEHYQ